ncbi:hypothetical protein J7T55_004115 [Diaporthe amygdali]|uniref:uncharacterized protein n=1 Tax=Phomopsis amygdali TaxID=1214568 RepID=UPI0022FECEE3|nr:uncharacterized protein J7T55_004115 [Diaporthe amygdali]KAJ0115945.1 hypothetical protein J7T55_004115 [Diaporthe amygdali]
MSSRQAALSLYRRSLKLALDWAVHRHLWRGQAIYIRSLFEANRNITEPRQQRALLKETEKLLDSWKHPDPYAPPTAPGGSKYERNLPAPILEQLANSLQRERAAVLCMRNRDPSPCYISKGAESDRPGLAYETWRNSRYRS